MFSRAYAALELPRQGAPALHLELLSQFLVYDLWGLGG